MHVVHFDLFLYVMRERNNRLFSENENTRIRQFSPSNGNKGEGPSRHPEKYPLSQGSECRNHPGDLETPTGPCAGIP